MWQTRMINATFVSSFTVLYLHPLFFGMQTIFAINLLLSIYIFATYLQGANLCQSIFSSSEFHLDKPEKSCSI